MSGLRWTDQTGHMSEKQKQAIDGQPDWHGWCRGCGNELYGTVASLKLHNGVCDGWKRLDNATG